MTQKIIDPEGPYFPMVMQQAEEVKRSLMDPPQVGKLLELSIELEDGSVLMTTVARVTGEDYKKLVAARAQAEAWMRT